MLQLQALGDLRRYRLASEASAVFTPWHIVAETPALLSRSGTSRHTVRKPA